MDQSLSITLVLEGGLPNLYLSVQDNYYSPAQLFNAPLEFIDLAALINSAQATGDYWMVTASPDNPRFQVESAIFVRHRGGKIHWDMVYEHYEPFLNIDLEEEADSYDENIVTFSFDPFQYISVLYQASLQCQHLQPTTFVFKDVDAITEHPIYLLAQQASRLYLLWQKIGQTNNQVANGKATATADQFAQEAEAQWLQDLLDTLDSAHDDNVMDNIDAYLDSLPEETLSHLENNSKQLETALIKRWEALVDSLTEEEADALENHQTTARFPNSLKLRLMREFLEGNPSVLLGANGSSSADDPSENVVDFQHWKRNHPTDSKSN